MKQFSGCLQVAFHLLEIALRSQVSTVAQCQGPSLLLIMNSMKLVIPLHFISWKKTPNDAVTPQRQSQFTPKMKANAVPRLLSSLVWIDKYNECNGMTSFMEFMFTGRFLWNVIRNICYPTFTWWRHFIWKDVCHVFLFFFNISSKNSMKMVRLK